VTDDDQRAAERRRRMADLLAQSEADVARTRAAAAAPPPVVDTRRRRPMMNALGVLILLAVAFLLVGTALTIGRFTGNNLDDARRRGTATVESCSKQGPISLKGFGFYDSCTVTIQWNTGPTSRVRIAKPGFFQGEKPGDSFEIGENTGSRGRIGYSRAALPDRGYVTVLAAIIGILGVLPLLAVAFYLREIIKDAFRRR
jgi:hypothetical protein